METNDKQFLRKLANTIIAFLPETNEIGLLDGNTGVCLFLYMYAKLTGDEEYSCLSDLLLTEVIGEVESGQDYSAYSVSTFGIGLLYFLSHNMVDNDSDSFLDRIDKIVLGKAAEGFIGNESNPYSSVYLKGFYLLFRLKWISKKVDNRLITDFLSEIDAFYQKVPEKGVAGLLCSQSYSVLYVMLSLQKDFCVDNDRINSIIDRLITLLGNNSTLEPAPLSIHYAISKCLGLLNQEDALYEMLNNKLEKYPVHKDIATWHENAWMDFLYQKCYLSSFSHKEIVNYFDNIIANSYYEKYSVSFRLASVGVSYMFNFNNK